ncbi:MAG: glutamine--tRNA ligase/YqeY domain fusion protein [Hahellaceae bacterium]|nr:glutamine--tRNA ligase/YqeY domain fusion protein [Hahellaceae bacterium]
MSSKEAKTVENKAPSNFIRHIIDNDLSARKHEKIVTRFPPEPNGYLHIGHAKSICLNFGLAQDYQGVCNLRFDDTNPEKESQEYIDSITRDVEWLGFAWAGEIRHASAYFDQLYDFAIELIRKGKAYVCSLTAEQMTEYRGSLKEPGKPSPYRDRSVEENLALFEKMRAGEFKEGECVLRAKIDMASPNINLRDPILYRIRFADHHQTGNKWCIYPMYDYTHPISDALEGITHSLCTLEFEDHRPLYDWVLDNITIACHPQQIEFSRLNVNYTVTSKRKLKRLVDEGLVNGWDDPRMPTIAGMRRRGFTPESLRRFCESVGVTKSEGVVDVAMLEHAIREDLNERAPRAMCVLDPLKIVLENYPEDKIELLTVPNHPQKPEMGERQLPWTREIFIDRADFIEVAPNKQWKRLALGESVRLRGGYCITCKEMITDEQGQLIELRCTYDPDTHGVNPQGYKPRGVLHWVSATECVDAEVRLYDRLFNHESPDANKDGVDFVTLMNPESLVVQACAKAEKSLASAGSEIPFQFEREGYFYRDPVETSALIFNRTITLRDSWGKADAKG